MNLYFIRHGETPWNKARRFQGQTDVPLNDFGRELAAVTRRAMPRLDWARVYASPLCRALETARILVEGRTAPDGTPLADRILTDDRLKEIAFGPYEGADVSAVAHDPAHPMHECLWHPDRYVAPEGAESFDDLIARARSFMDGVLRPLEAELPAEADVLVVAHGALIRAVVVGLGRKSVADFWRVPYHNCCVTRLTLREGQFTLEDEARIYYDSEQAAWGWRQWLSDRQNEPAT